MRMSRPRLALPALVLVAATVGAACSASPPAEAPSSQPPAPPYASSQQGYAQPSGYPAATATAVGLGAVGSANPWATLPAPSDVPSGLAQIDAAERALAQVLGPEVKTVPAEPGRPRANAPSADALAQDQACTIACYALASMKRSAEHVCTMAGDADAACGTARERVTRAEARVTAACPACSK